MGGVQSDGSRGLDGSRGPQSLDGPYGLAGPEGPYDDGENALRVLRIIEAAYRSSETGRMVSLEQDPQRED